MQNDYRSGSGRDRHTRCFAPNFRNGIFDLAQLNTGRAALFQFFGGRGKRI